MASLQLEFLVCMGSVLLSRVKQRNNLRKVHDCLSGERRWGSCCWVVPFCENCVWCMCISDINRLICECDLGEMIWIVWLVRCCTCSEKRSSTHSCHCQLVAAHCSYLLYNAATCFGHTSRPSSGELQVGSTHTAYIVKPFLKHYIYLFRVTQRRSWLRHCVTSRNDVGSIPDGVIGIFHSYNPSGHTAALGLTQPLTEMGTRNISCGVKAAGAWQPYHLHLPTVLKSASLNLLEPPGPVQACTRIALPFISTCLYSNSHHCYFIALRMYKVCSCLCQVAMYAVHVDQICSSLKMAETYGRNI
jgi:hypothetical protein